MICVSIVLSFCKLAENLQPNKRFSLPFFTAMSAVLLCCRAKLENETTIDSLKKPFFVFVYLPDLEWDLIILKKSNMKLWW